MAAYTKIANSLFMARMQAKQQLASQMRQERMLQEQRDLAASDRIMQVMAQQDERSYRDRQLGLQEAKQKAEATALAGKPAPQFENALAQTFGETGTMMGEARVIEQQRQADTQRMIQQMQADRQAKQHEATLKAIGERGRVKKDVMGEKDRLDLMRKQNMSMNEFLQDADVGTRRNYSRAMEDAGITGDQKYWDLTPEQRELVGSRADQFDFKKGEKSASRIYTGDNIPGTTGFLTAEEKMLAGFKRQRKGLGVLQTFDAGNFLGSYNKVKGKMLKAAADMGAFEFDEAGNMNARHMFASIANAVASIAIDPKEADQWLGELQKFTSLTEGLFNEYRKYVTGAAAATSELKILQRSFMNMAMDPRSFKGALEWFKNKLDRDEKVAEELIRDGFKPSENPEENKEFAEKFLERTGGAASFGKVDAPAGASGGGSAAQEAAAKF